MEGFQCFCAPHVGLGFALGIKRKKNLASTDEQIPDETFFVAPRAPDSTDEKLPTKNFSSLSGAGIDRRKTPTKNVSSFFFVGVFGAAEPTNNFRRKFVRRFSGPQAAENSTERKT